MCPGKPNNMTHTYALGMASYRKINPIIGNMSTCMIFNEVIFAILSCKMANETVYAVALY